METGRSSWGLGRKLGRLTHLRQMPLWSLGRHLTLASLQASQAPLTRGFAVTVPELAAMTAVSLWLLLLLAAAVATPGPWAESMAEERERKSLRRCTRY